MDLLISTFAPATLWKIIEKNPLKRRRHSSVDRQLLARRESWATHLSRRSPSASDRSHFSGSYISSISRCFLYPFRNIGNVQVKNNLDKMFADSQGFGSSRRRADSILLRCAMALWLVRIPCNAQSHNNLVIYRNRNVQLKLWSTYPRRCGARCLVPSIRCSTRQSRSNARTSLWNEIESWNATFS